MKRLLSLLRNKKPFNRSVVQVLVGVVVIVGVATLGYHLLVASHAATPYAAAYAANGKLITPATLVSGGSNANSQAVQFGSMSTPSPANCTSPNYTSSSTSGSVNYGSYTVEQDMWNPVSITQSLSACNYNSWYVTAQVANQNDGYCATVQSYPDTRINEPSQTIASMTTMTSDFGDMTPPTGSGLCYESAYDIWLGPSVNGYDTTNNTELMIWTDVDGVTPAGSVVGTVSLDGMSWKIYLANTPSSSGGDLLSYVAETNFTSGGLNLLAFFDDAASRGYLEAGTSTPLWQVDYGYELYSIPANTVLGINNFSLTYSQ